MINQQQRKQIKNIIYIYTLTYTKQKQTEYITECQHE